jgi:hypothetical protein
LKKKTDVKKYSHKNNSVEFTDLIILAAKTIAKSRAPKVEETLDQEIEDNPEATDKFANTVQVEQI